MYPKIFHSREDTLFMLNFNLNRLCFKVRLVCTGWRFTYDANKC